MTWKNSPIPRPPTRPVYLSPGARKARWRSGRVPTPPMDLSTTRMQRVTSTALRMSLLLPWPCREGAGDLSLPIEEHPQPPRSPGRAEIHSL